MKRRTRILLILTAVLLILILPGFCNVLTARRYNINAPGMEDAAEVACSLKNWAGNNIEE